MKIYGITHGTKATLFNILIKRFIFIALCWVLFAFLLDTIIRSLFFYIVWKCLGTFPTPSSLYSIAVGFIILFLFVICYILFNTRRSKSFASFILNKFWTIIIIFSGWIIFSLLYCGHVIDDDCLNKGEYNEGAKFYGNYVKSDWNYNNPLNLGCLFDKWGNRVAYGCIIFEYTNNKTQETEFVGCTHCWDDLKGFYLTRYTEKGLFIGDVHIYDYDGTLFDSGNIHEIVDFISENYGVIKAYYIDRKGMDINMLSYLDDFQQRILKYEDYLREEEYKRYERELTRKEKKQNKKENIDKRNKKDIIEGYEKICTVDIYFDCAGETKRMGTLDLALRKVGDENFYFVNDGNTWKSLIAGSYNVNGVIFNSSFKNASGTPIYLDNPAFISSSAQQESRPTSQDPQYKSRKVPVQVFKKCNICGGSTICRQCGGNGGFEFFNGSHMVWNECVSCRGFKKCVFCGGKGGEYVVEYVDSERN